MVFMETMDSHACRLPRLLFLTLMFSLPPLGLAQVPRGVFCLLPSGQGAGKDPAIYSDPSVDGISVRQSWYNLEPSEGVFDFSFLDAVASMARVSGKEVLLRIGTSGGSAAKGGNTPNWVFDAINAEPLPTSQKFFTWNDNGTMRTIPVFWDPVYLAKKIAMIAALGAHFANNPIIKIVSASFANAQSEDWGVPGTATDVANWLAAGYTTAKMLNAGRQIINATMAAFPYQYVTLAVGGNGPSLDPDPSYVARNAVLAARASWPGRLIVQKNSLATYIPPPPGTRTLYQLEWDSAPDIGAQMLWYCYGDNTYRVNGGVPIDPSKALTKSVDIGVGYGVKYIEIYRVDILSLPAATKNAHDALTRTSWQLVGVADFNGDGKPDYVLYNPNTRQTGIWYLDNNVYAGSAFGPSLAGTPWQLVGVADFNGDGKPDYLLYNPNTRQTGIWYLNNNVYIGSAFGPSLAGTPWQLVGVADFNGDGKPDYVLYNPNTRQTGIWYLNNNVYAGSAFGPSLAGTPWQLVGVADFNGDGKPDYVLYNPNTRQTGFWYLNNNVYDSSAYGPSLAGIPWQLVGVADFNGDGKPDYMLYNPNTRQTGLWYLNNNVYSSSAFGPTLQVP
jgi:hypothetical protein